MSIMEFGQRSFITWTTGLKERMAEKEIQMSREIKFRAWADNKMHYDNFSIEFNGGEMDSMIAYTHSDGKVITCEDFILMQFTGLKDKNSKEIYEGDILREPPRDQWEETNYSAFEVFFHDNDCADRHIGFQMNRMHNYGAVAGGCCYYHFLPKTTAKFEIIGDIHQNPELLEQENGKS